MALSKLLLHAFLCIVVLTVKLECVYEFAYLGNMLNDTGGAEQAVATRMRAAWMKFREFSGILCARGASL